MHHTSTNNTFITILLSITLVLGAGAVTLPQDAQATNNDCSQDTENNLEVTDFSPEDGEITIENTSGDCSYDVGLAAYKGFELRDDNSNQLKTGDQVLHDSATTTLEAEGSTTLEVDTPQCAYQIDAFYGSEVIEDLGSDLYNDRKLDMDEYKNGEAFSHENTDDLHEREDGDIVCSINDDGDGSLTVTKNVTNNDGGEKDPDDFEIIVTDPDADSKEVASFDGSSEGVSVDLAPGNYTVTEENAGDYTADFSDCSDGSVAVNSNETTHCTITNNDNEQEDGNDQDPEDETDEGDDGQGGGGGTVLPPKDDDDEDEDGDDLDYSVRCVPNDSSVLVGERVTFEAEVSGDLDNDDVDFSWDGSDRLDSDENEASVQYTASGTKTVTVTAGYEDQEEVDECEVEVQSGQVKSSTSSGVSLATVPSTGPTDSAKTLGFIAGLILIALTSGLVIIRRSSEEGVPVGIPQE